MMWTTCTIILTIILLIALVMNLLLNNYALKSKYDATINASKTLEGMTVPLLFEDYNPHTTYFYNATLVTVSDVLSSEIRKGLSI